VARWEKAAYSLRDTSTANRIAADSLILTNIVDAEVGAQFHAGQSGGTFDPGTYNLTASALTAAATFAGLPANPSAGGDFNWALAGASEANTGGLNPFTGDILTKAGAAVTATIIAARWIPRALRYQADQLRRQLAGGQPNADGRRHWRRPFR
jgi:hypothetical protein